jgi:hypothetical protein
VVTDVNTRPSGLVYGRDKFPADWLVDECEFALFFATSFALPTSADRGAEACGVGTQGSRVVDAITARRRRTLVEALARVPLAEALDDGFYGSIAAMAAKSASTDPICRARSGFTPRTCNRRALMRRRGGIDHTGEKFRLLLGASQSRSHVVVSQCPPANRLWGDEAPPWPDQTNHASSDFRFWPEADVAWARWDVRFQGKSGHDADRLSFPGLTQTGPEPQFQEQLSLIRPCVPLAPRRCTQGRPRNRQ